MSDLRRTHAEPEPKPQAAQGAGGPSEAEKETEDRGVEAEVSAVPPFPRARLAWLPPEGTPLAIPFLRIPLEDPRRSEKLGVRGRWNCASRRLMMHVL